MRHRIGTVFALERSRMVDLDVDQTPNQPATRNLDKCAEEFGAERKID